MKRKTKAELKIDMSNAEVNLSRVQGYFDRAHSENIDLKSKLSQAETDLQTLAKLNGEANLKRENAEQQLEAVLRWASKDQKKAMIEEGVLPNEGDLVNAEGY